MTVYRSLSPLARPGFARCVRFCGAGLVLTVVSAAVLLAAPATFAVGGNFEGTVSGSVVLADGPVAYWQFAEAAGSAVARDSSSNGRDGRFVGAATLGQPGAFAGSSSVGFEAARKQFVEVPAGSLTGPARVTVEAWARSPTQTWNEWGTFVAKRYAFELSPVPARSGLSGKGVRLYFWVEAMPEQWLGWEPDPAMGFDITQWHHYAASFDGQRVALFVDGREMASRTLARAGRLNADAGLLSIGRDDVPWDARYGTISVDEVAVFDKALTAAQIQAHYCAAGRCDPATQTLAEAAVYAFGTNGRLKRTSDQLLPATGNPALFPQWTGQEKAPTPYGNFWTANRRAWTSGFFSGSLWYASASAPHDDKPMWRGLAQRWMRGMRAQATAIQDHDVGFRIFVPFGNAYRLTSDATVGASDSRADYRKAILDAAETLYARFDPALETFRSTDAAPVPNTQYQQFHVIIDTMMNLELLVWASAHVTAAEKLEYPHSEQWWTAAVQHADTVLERLQQAESGLVCQDVWYRTPEPGAALGYTQVPSQPLWGYRCDPPSISWARGQAWALYGFTMMYRYTTYDRFRAAAEKSAAFFLNPSSAGAPYSLPADGVPRYEFDRPAGSLRDASAAAIAASALLDLSRLELRGTTADTVKSSEYLASARNLLTVLSKPCPQNDPARTDPPACYLSRGSSSQAILLHTSSHDNAWDGGSTWGDYYFVEALQRLNGVWMPDDGFAP